MQSTPHRLTRYLLLALIVSASVGCDQVTKKMATQTLEGSAAVSYFGDTFRLQYTLNPGAFLGVGGGLPESWRAGLIIAMNAILTAVVASLLFVKWNVDRRTFVAFALLLGGGLGYLLDRVRLSGTVTDFMNVGIGPVRTGIFNFADVAIMAAFVLFAIDWFGTKKLQPVAIEKQ